MGGNLQPDAAVFGHNTKRRCLGVWFTEQAGTRAINKKKNAGGTTGSGKKIKNAQKPKTGSEKKMKKTS